ncbi:hypothetical protein Tco_1174487 [Tanacetum coccineum]
MIRRSGRIEQIESHIISERKGKMCVTKIVLLGLKGIPLASRFVGTRGCVFNKGLFGVFHAILIAVGTTADFTWDSDFVYLVIMESLVKKKQKGAILELKRRHLKNTIFCTYTPYPAMKIRRISASSAQETRNDQFPIWRIHYNQYAVCTAVLRSRYALIELM